MDDISTRIQILETLVQMLDTSKMETNLNCDFLRIVKKLINFADGPGVASRATDLHVW
jgi:hypothetical protein